MSQPALRRYWTAVEIHQENPGFACAPTIELKAVYLAADIEHVLKELIEVLKEADETHGTTSRNLERATRLLARLTEGA